MFVYKARLFEASRRKFQSYLDSTTYQVDSGINNYSHAIVELRIPRARAKTKMAAFLYGVCNQPILPIKRMLLTLQSR